MSVLIIGGDDVCVNIDVCYAFKLPRRAVTTCSMLCCDIRPNTFYRITTNPTRWASHAQFSVLDTFK